MPPAQAFGYIAAGGVGAVAASWFGVGAVLFAMTRLLRARAPFWSVLWALAGALPPLWIAAPAAALVVAGSGGVALTAVVVLAGAAFLVLAARGLAEVAGLAAARRRLPRAHPGFLRQRDVAKLIARPTGDTVP